MTADRELSTFWSNLVGVKLVLHLDRLVVGLSIEAKIDFFYFSYIDFAWLTDRTGADLGLGASLAF